MAETFERLGIQLELESEIKGNPTEVLANLKKSLEEIARVLNGIDLSKLGKGKVGDIGSDLKKTKDSAKDATSGLKEVAAAVADVNQALAAQSKFIQYAGKDFNEFLKINRKQFLEMAEGSNEIASKMASPFYQELSKIRKEAGKIELKGLRKEMQDTADVSAVVGKKIADNLVSMLNFSPDGKSATKLRSVIEGAIRINSGTADLKQLERSNDIMVQIGNNAFHAKTQTEQLANTIANRLRRGTLEEADIKIFSKEKFDRDVKSVMTQLSGLRDFTEKNGLSTKGIGSLETKALNAKTLSDLDKVRDKIAEIKTAANRDLTFTKLEEQAAKLRRAYEGIRLPDDLLSKLNALNRSNFDNSYKGTAAFGRAIQDTKVSLSPIASPSYSRIADVGQAQTLAINEQISRTLDTLKAKSIDTKLSVTQLTDEFRKAGIQIKELNPDQINKLNSGVKTLGFTLTSTAGGFTTISKETTFLSEAISKMTKRLVEFYSIRTVLFAVGAQMRQAVSASIDMNQAIYDILAISGEAKSEFNNIGDSIYNIAKNSRFTAMEVSQLMQVLAQAGIQAKDLATVSQATGVFATATASDPKMAADLVTTSMNVYRMEAGRTASITNSLTAALNLSKLEASGLATAFNYLAPQAAQLGMSLDETLGIIATMAQSGIKPSTIGTGISQLLKELSAPKPRLRNLLDAYKINPDDVNPMMQSFADIVQRFQDAGVTVDNLFQALESRVGRAAVTAINFSAESFRNMTTSISGTQAALIAYDKSMDGANARMNQIKQTFQELVTQVGNTLAPVFITATEVLKGFLNVLSSGEGAVATTIVSLSGIGAAGLAVNAIKNSFVGYVTAVQAATTATTALNIAQTASLGIMGAATKVSAILGGLLSPGGVIIAGILAITAALGGLFYWLNRNKREQEEANKTYLEQVDRGERLDRTLNSIVNSTRETSDAYAKYSKLVREGKTHEEALAVIGKQHIKIKDDQRKELLKYVADGGPHAKYIEALLKEGETLEAIIFLERQRRVERNTNTFNDLQEYNKQATDLRKSRDERVQNRQQTKYFYETEEQSRQAVLKQDKDQLKALRERISGKELYDERTGMPSGFITTNEETLEAKLNAIKPPEKPKKGKNGIQERGGAGTENQYNSSKVILENLRLEREEILTRVKTIYQTADELEAAFKRIEQIDKEYAQASGEKAEQDVIANAKNIIKKEGQAKYEEYLKNAQEVDNKKLAQLKAKQAKERQEIEKLQQQHELEIVRIEQDAQKKANEARIANLTKQITSAYTGDVDRSKFVAEALGLTEANIDAEIDKQIAELTEKQRQAAERLDYTGVGRYQNQINNLNYDTRSGMKTEASKALNQQAVQGIQAAEEKALQLEQQKLVIIEKQIAARKDSAWGAAAVNALDIERLEAAKKAAQEERRIVLEKQKQIPAGELTNELADRYKTKLDGIAEKEKEITREIQKRNQGTLGNFVDGMQEAWNRISDVNAAAKELGSTITNTFVNGLGTTLSNTFSTAFFPDQGKINEIQTKINELRTQKADLEGNIGTIERNTDKTPEEIKNLNDYKTKLDEVNNALRQQEEAVRKQKDAWSTFAEGLKGIMKTILQELQNYIAKLLVVWAVQQMVGLTFNAFGGADAANSGKWYSGIMQGMGEFSGKLPAKAKGGLVEGYAEGGLVNGISGGLIPETMGVKGKDSVPILAMPEEYIIPASVVKTWGSGHFEKYRNGTFKKMAEGGLVGGGTAGSSANADTAKEYNLQIVNITSNDQVPSPDQQATQIINVINADLARRGPTYKNFKAAMAN